MNNLKRILATVALSGGAVAVSHAAPFLAVGDGAEVFFTGVVGARYDSNIFLSANNTKSDTIFSVNPGLLYTFGKGSDTTGSLSLVEDFDLYSSNSNLNTQLFQGDFAANYDNDKTKANLSAFYHQLNQNDVNVRGLARRDEANVSAGGEIQLADKESLGAGLTYDNTHFKSKGYDSNSSYTIPVNGYYAVTPKVDLSAGYRFKRIDNDFAANESDNYFNVGARGEFTPKLTGSVDVGYELADYTKVPVTPGSTTTHSTSEGNLGYDANLVYAYSEKTSFTLGGSNSYGTDSFGDRQRSTSLSLRGETQLVDQFDGFAQVAYAHNVYPQLRTDDFYDSSVGVTYTLSKQVSVTAGYDYRTNSSTQSGAQFNENLLSVSASLRY